MYGRDSNSQLSDRKLRYLTLGQHDCFATISIDKKFVSTRTVQPRQVLSRSFESTMEWGLRDLSNFPTIGRCGRQLSGRVDIIPGPIMPIPPEKSMYRIIYLLSQVMLPPPSSSHCHRGWHDDACNFLTSLKNDIRNQFDLDQ